MTNAANTRVKNNRAVVIGQSNERGKRQQQVVAGLDGDAQFSLSGCPVADPIEPNGDLISPTNGFYGSMWPKVAEGMWKHNKSWITFRNHARGATSWAEHWTGDPSGVGTGVPYTSVDGGFDPLGYLAAALADAQTGTYDERWVFMANGQKDATNMATQANYQAAIESIVNYFLDNNVKVAIGFTIYNEAWMINTGTPAVTAALATFSGNANVIAGANLTTEIGDGVGLFDGHMDKRAYDLGSKYWVDSLVAANF